MDDVMNFIWNHAKQNLTYKEISAALKKKKNTQLSPDAIRKRLKLSGFPCRRGPTVHSRNDVKNAIRDLLPSIPGTVGYRQLTDTLRQKEIHVLRDTVMEILRELDPFGVQFRRKRRIQRKIYRSLGPNHIWHVDGYDKIKPYGFPIHGCIDGYSRKIMWLKVGPSNNDPVVVANNYVRCVDKLKGCPLVLQADPGTENGIIGALQCLFRHNATDAFSGIYSFRVVRSVFNQVFMTAFTTSVKRISILLINKPHRRRGVVPKVLTLKLRHFFGEKVGKVHKHGKRLCTSTLTYTL